MIRLKDGKVYLNKEDLKGLTGIWNAFRMHPDYCADLLLIGRDHPEYFKDDPESFKEEVDPEIPVSEFVNIFKIVFEQENYEIVE